MAELTKPGRVTLEARARQGGAQEHHALDLSPGGIKAAIERLKNGTRFQLVEGREHPVDTSDPVLYERVAHIVQRRVERLKKVQDPRLSSGRDEVLRQVLNEMATDPESVAMTPELYYRAKLIAEQPEEDVSGEDAVLPYVMKILVHTIDQRVRDRYAQSLEAEHADFQDQLVSDAVDIAILEQRMSRHEFSGLNKSYEVMRDRFLIERDRLQREIQATGKPLVLLSIEMDIKGLKNLNDVFGANIVDRDVFGPLGKILSSGLRDTDFASHQSFPSQPAGDEFPLMINLVEPDKVELIAQRLHDMIAQTPYREGIDHNLIKFRIGVRVFTLEEVNALPADDVVEFITAFRNDALQATAAGKRQKKDTVIWTPELAQQGGEQAIEQLTDRLRRDLSGFLADARQVLGEEVAREAEARLLAMWETLLAKRSEPLPSSASVKSE